MREMKQNRERIRGKNENNRQKQIQRREEKN